MGTIYAIIVNRGDLPYAVYIGATTNYEQRKSVHLTELKYAKHKNKNLLRDYQKYGVESLSWQILESCSNKLLYKIERNYILYYRKELGDERIYNRTDWIDGEKPTKAWICPSCKEWKTKQQQVKAIKERKYYTQNKGLLICSDCRLNSNLR